MTPNLKLYNYAFEKLQGYGIDVISSKEIDQILPYPFLVIKNPTSNRETHTYDSYTGITTLIIDIWSLADDLGKNDELISKVLDALTPNIITEQYQFIENSVNITTLEDNTTNQLLLHSSITIEFNTY